MDEFWEITEENITLPTIDLFSLLEALDRWIIWAQALENTGRWRQ